MVWGVLPLEPHISWESHLSGAIGGLLMAWIYRKVPPAHVPPPIVLEDDPEEPELQVVTNNDPGDEEPTTAAPVEPRPSADPLRFLDGGPTI